MTSFCLFGLKFGYRLVVWMIGGSGVGVWCLGFYKVVLLELWVVWWFYCWVFWGLWFTVGFVSGCCYPSLQAWIVFGLVC